MTTENIDNKVEGWLLYRDEFVAIIEKDEAIRDPIHNYFLENNINSKVFESADNFIKQIEQKIALFLLGINSDDFYQKKIVNKIYEKYKNSAIIILTSVADVQFALECLRSGVDEVLIKPIKLNEILLLTKRVLEKRVLIIENNRYRDDLEKKVMETIESDNQNKIYRCLEFPPEFHQAGISILNYFSRIVELKYPDIPIQIKIEQDGKKVAMTIVTPEGKREKIIKTLEEYSLVVQGKFLPEDLLPEPYQVIELKHKLDMTKLELKHTAELMCSQNDQFKNRITSLEDQIKSLKDIVAKGLDNSDNLQQLISGIFEKDYRFESVRNELLILQRMISRGLNKRSENEVKNILFAIKKKEPSLFIQLVDLLLKGSISGAAGNFLYSWIVAVANSLPK